MDYIGSKEKLNDWLFSIMLENKSNPSKLTFMDGCAGSGSVSKHAASLGFGKIVSNDLLAFSQHIVRGAISMPSSLCEEAIELIDKMNTLDGKTGFFYDNYSEKSGRLYFNNHNAKKIDAMRQFIERQDNPYIRSYLLYCMLEAVSGVSNTTGVQAAFLKKIKERAQKDIVVKPLKSMCMPGVVKTFNKDVLDLLNSLSLRDGYKEDILYLDPPYNERQYGPNYHIYETLVRYDDPKIAGKTGLRNWKNESKSPFCSRKTCLEFTNQVVKSTRAKDVYISYSSDGLLSIADFRSAFPDLIVQKKQPRRYKADISKEREYDNSKLYEYLIHIRK